ncbi:hypothetical protein [Thermostaphylospora chromogena]|uniref:Uncharacterized protein n=1 Tax=Thermostaphylospora chromogena TaxID=35622 RepID=A0A1H0ZR28_9ACTN|nr:hypothetical protein [Thermostaphylospora chromogena]SDQ29955.1 hypothetical protein SAMN04489764_0100 [Thermostaphylospora chromogena]
MTASIVRRTARTRISIAIVLSAILSTCAGLALSNPAHAAVPGGDEWRSAAVEDDDFPWG